MRFSAAFNIHLFLHLSIYTLLLLGVGDTLFAQNITGLVTDIKNTPLQGANVIWKGTNIGTSTDENGVFKIANIEGKERILEISFVGYQMESLPVGNVVYWEIQLIEDPALVSVEIRAKGQATKFLNDVAKVEVLGVREIQRAACCSLAGCFSTNSNVESNVTNVVTDAKELRILGLSGVYNQVLVEGLPLVQGLSYPYGPGSYPGTMIEKIFVTKGANSVLQGFESISGQINIEFPRVENAPKFFFNVFGNSFGESQYNANFMLKKTAWSNFTTAHLTLPSQIIDRDQDGFRDVVKTNRMSFFNRWSYDNAEKPKWRVTLGVRVLEENREGGSTQYTKSKNLGDDKVYGQNVSIHHQEAYSKINYILGEKSSLIMLNGAFHQIQNSYFGVKKYDGNQFNITSSLYLDHYYGKGNHNLKIGISHRHNAMDEEIIALKDIPNMNYIGKYETNFDIPGLFLENKYQFGKYTILSGIRVDRQNKIGWSFVPRLLIRAAWTPETDIRFSIGKGYRNAFIFAENSNLLASNRSLYISNNLQPEQAVNVGINGVHKIKWKEILITLSSDFYITYFQNQIFPDYDLFLNSATIDNFFGKSISKSFQFENKWEFSPRFDVKWAYNFLDLYREQNGSKVDIPFVSKHKWIVNSSYSTVNDKWQFDLTYRRYGPKKLPSTMNYPTEYQLQGYSPTYALIDLQLTHRWSTFQIYGGIENIFNFRQNFPILGYKDPYGTYFDPSFNWGPTKGRELFLGLRYSMQ